MSLFRKVCSTPIRLNKLKGGKVIIFEMLFHVTETIFLMGTFKKLVSEVANGKISFSYSKRSTTAAENHNYKIQIWVESMKSFHRKASSGLLEDSQGRFDVCLSGSSSRQFIIIYPAVTAIKRFTYK